MQGFCLVNLLSQVLGSLHELFSCGGWLVNIRTDGPSWRVFLGVAGDEPAALPAENIVDKTFSKRDTLVVCHSRRLKSGVAEFVH